jgi:hypothetical protein
MRTSDAKVAETVLLLRRGLGAPHGSIGMIKITKSVTFKLDNGEDSLSLPKLMDQGYTRPDIIELFETLHGLEFGEYREGSRGRNQFHRFLKNNKCPKEFVLCIEQQPRGRPRAAANVETVNVVRSPDEAELDDISMEINSGDVVAYDIVDVTTEIPMSNASVETVMISDSPDGTDNELAQAVLLEAADASPIGEPDEMAEAVELNSIEDDSDDIDELASAAEETPIDEQELSEATDEAVLDSDLMEAKVVSDLGSVVSGMVVIPNAPKPQIQASEADDSDIGADETASA